MRSEISDAASSQAEGSDATSRQPDGSPECKRAKKASRMSKMMMDIALLTNEETVPGGDVLIYRPPE